MDHSKKKIFPVDVHHIYGGMSEIQERYGMRIMDGIAQWRSEADGFYRSQPRKFEFYSICQLIDGAGHLWLEETGEIAVRKNSFILVAPGVINRYGGAEQQCFVEDFIRFYGPAVDQLCRAGVVKSGVFELGAVRRLPPIMKLAQNPSKSAQIEANFELQKLLMEIYFLRRKHKSEIHDPVDWALREINRNIAAWYQVQELAEMTQLSSDVFRRRFLQKTGMLPKHYIEHLKLRRAAEALIAGNAPIAEIAAEMGYVDPYHFSRRFKMVFSVSPEGYRRNSRNAMRH